jgi:hypothetical protein
MKVINVDRLNCLPGAGPYDHDNAIVVSESEMEPHIITGKAQRKILFRGTLADCHSWVRAKSGICNHATAGMAD